MITPADLTQRVLTCPHNHPFVFSIEEIYNWFPALIEAGKLTALYQYASYIDDKEGVILVIQAQHEVEVYWTNRDSTNFLSSMCIDKGTDCSKTKIQIPPEYIDTIQYIKTNVNSLPLNLKR